MSSGAGIVVGSASLSGTALALALSKHSIPFKFLSQVPLEHYLQMSGQPVYINQDTIKAFEFLGLGDAVKRKSSRYPGTIVATSDLKHIYSFLEDDIPGQNPKYPGRMTNYSTLADILYTSTIDDINDNWNSSNSSFPKIAKPLMFHKSKSKSRAKAKAKTSLHTLNLNSNPTNDDTSNSHRVPLEITDSPLEYLDYLDQKNKETTPRISKPEPWEFLQIQKDNPAFTPSEYTSPTIDIKETVGTDMQARLLHTFPGLGRIFFRKNRDSFIHSLHSRKSILKFKNDASVPLGLFLCGAQPGSPVETFPLLNWQTTFGDDIPLCTPAGSVSLSSMVPRLPLESEQSLVKKILGDSKFDSLFENLYQKKASPDDNDSGDTKDTKIPKSKGYSSYLDLDSQQDSLFIHQHTPSSPAPGIQIWDDSGQGIW